MKKSTWTLIIIIKMKNLLEGMEDKAEEVFQKREQRRSKKSKKKRTLENQYRCSPSDY